MSRVKWWDLDTSEIGGAGGTGVSPVETFVDTATTPVEREMSSYEMARELERISRSICAKLARSTSAEMRSNLSLAYKEAGMAKYYMDKIDRLEADR